MITYSHIQNLCFINKLWNSGFHLLLVCLCIFNYAHAEVAFVGLFYLLYVLKKIVMLCKYKCTKTFVNKNQNIKKPWWSSSRAKPGRLCVNSIKVMIYNVYLVHWILKLIIFQIIFFYSSNILTERVQYFTHLLFYVCT